uniref:NADH dehydrogenase subunit 6 n=1 Tax=Thaumatomyia glabra TaxID=1479690 RepID=UPI0023D808F2|nr:NADH dehydrogenase subunit 6 [Thaumatomyia glabra]WDA94059.1 NADH dehydrogenase subunit 6 [Thaumatomyia glabra]
MIQFMYLLSFSISLIFMQINHPLAMGLTLLIQTIFICILTGLITKTFWFSYVLFLIFLGGMLVLFIYVTSLASNEMFSFSTKLITYSVILITINSLIILFMNDFSYFNINIFNNEMNSLTDNVMLLKENTLSLNKLYNYPTNMITILLMNYLLITLIAIVKITKLFYGPLRMMN